MTTLHGPLQRLFAFAALLLLPLAAASAERPRPSAAVPTPALRGVVVDSAGRPIADVQVVVNALNRVTTTNDSGRFAFAGLPAGSYHITALQIGYRPGHADIVIPAAGADVPVRITMARATTVAQLGAVQVTATPIGTDPRDVAQSTTELSAAQLARRLTGSVAQTLASEPGISVRFNGPAASAPVIRGLSGERILVLQDGARAGDLSSTSPDHGVTIDPLTAQRIEVVRGPASLLYGNNALGGVVNVISNDLPTSIPEHVHGYVNSSAESGAPGAAIAAGVTLPVSSTLAIVGRGEARHADDLRTGKGVILRNSYSNNRSGAGGIGYVGPAATAGLLFRAYGFDYGLPSGDGEGASIRGDRQELNARAELAAPPSIFTSLRLNGTAQWYGHDEVEPSGELATSFKLRTQTLDLLGRTQFGRVAGALGASGTFRQYSAQGEEALTPAANSTGAGVFVYEEVPLGTPSSDEHARRPSLQLGARYDLFTIRSRTGEAKFGPGRTRDFHNFSGSIGVSVPLTEDVSLGVSAARAFRAPTVEELFSNAFHAAAGTYDIGNPALRAETNQGLDAILRAQRERVTAQLSAYYNRVDNFIAPNIVKDTIVETEDGLDAVPLNRFTQGDASLTGVEGKLEVEVLPRIVVGVTGDALRGRFLGGGALPYMPPARLGGLVRFDDTRFSVDAEYRHGFAQTDVPVAGSRDDPAAVTTGAYDLLDLSAGYTFALGGRTHSITVRADNLTDTQYRDASSRIKGFAFNPGRNVALVYRLLF